MSFVLLGILNSQAAGAGGAPAYDLLETQVLTSSATSVTFTGLGSYSDYKHLQIRMTGRVDNATAYNLYHMRLNGDSGSNYSRHQLFGDGSSVSSAGAATQIVMNVGVAPGASVSANIYNGAVIDLLDFASSSKNTTMRSLSGSAGGGLDNITLASSAYLLTTSVTSVEILSIGENWVTGSRFSLYGIKGE